MASYATVSELASMLRIEDYTEDAELEVFVDSASRIIDNHCGWGIPFQTEASSATASLFNAQYADLCFTYPIGSTTGLVVKTDTNGDGTFDTTWAATDYQLEPLNQTRAGITDHPYFKIRAINRYLFPTVEHEARVEVTAQWGWTSGVPDVIHAATLLIAKDLFIERNTLGGVAFGEGGAVAYMRAVSPRVAMMLAGYTRARFL